jgi:hypothetical protein
MHNSELRIEIVLLIGFVSCWLVIEKRCCHADSKRLRRFPIESCLAGWCCLLLFGTRKLAPHTPAYTRKHDENTSHTLQI